MTHIISLCAATCALICMQNASAIERLISQLPDTLDESRIILKEPTPLLPGTQEISKKLDDLISRTRKIKTQQTKSNGQLLCDIVDLMRDSGRLAHENGVAPEKDIYLGCKYKGLFNLITVGNRIRPESIILCSLDQTPLKAQTATELQTLTAEMESVKTKALELANAITENGEQLVLPLAEQKDYLCFFFWHLLLLMQDTWGTEVFANNINETILPTLDVVKYNWLVYRRSGETYRSYCDRLGKPLAPEFIIAHYINLAQSGVDKYLDNSIKEIEGSKEIELVE